MAFQFDAGRSTVQRLAAVGVWPGNLTALFVTHHHSDHLTGLQDVVLTRWTLDRGSDTPPLPIIAPAGPAESFVSRMLDAWDADIDVRALHAGRDTRPAVDLRAFPYPMHPSEVYRIETEQGAVTVVAGQVRHEPVHPAVGYRITTPDGSIAISGDTLVCDEVAELAEGVDVLVYEALRFSAFEHMPPERRFILDYHADTRLIGRQAAELGVKTLVLTHLIPEPTNADDQRAYEDDIRSGGFAGTLVVANDLDTVTLG
jgi:ribonuclease Z